MEGEYSCKASSSAGTHVTKARLHVHELTGPEREQWLEKKAQMEVDKKAKETKPKKEKDRSKPSKADYLRQAIEKR